MTLFSGLSAFSITPTDTAGRVDTAALGRLLDRLAAVRCRRRSNKGEQFYCSNKPMVYLHRVRALV